jgi:hypothetical protein
VRVYFIGSVLPKEIKTTPTLVADMDGLFGANGIGTGIYGQRIVISAVDQRIVISAVDQRIVISAIDGLNGGEISTEDKGIFILHC